jgi:branched-chain amino acid transport system substrate-binding protein
MKKARLSLFVMAVMALVLGACLAPSVAADVPGVTDTSIKIGGPMLITGPIAVLGTAAADGLGIYWKWLNDQGGVHGRKVECLLEDDGYNPTRAVAAARKLITRAKVFGFLTTSGTPQTLQLMPILEKEKVPALSGIVPSFPGIMKTLPNMFTFGMPYGDQIILGIDYFIKNLKKKQPTLGIIYQDDAYGKEVKRGMDLAAKKYGLKVVGTETYKRGALDFSTQALNLKRANPDLVIMGTVVRETTAFMNEADKLGWHPVCLANSAICDEKMFELLGPKIKNLYTVNYIARAWEDVPGMKQLREVYKKYRPDIKDIQHYHILGYLNSLIFNEALERSGKKLTREGWIKAMESIKDFYTGGLTGSISFGPDMHSAKCQARVFKADLEKKRWVPVTDYQLPSVQ